MWASFIAMEEMWSNLYKIISLKIHIVTTKFHFSKFLKSSNISTLEPCIHLRNTHQNPGSDLFFTQGMDFYIFSHKASSVVSIFSYFLLHKMNTFVVKCWQSMKWFISLSAYCYFIYIILCFIKYPCFFVSILKNLDFLC